MAPDTTGVALIAAVAAVVAVVLTASLWTVASKRRWRWVIRVSTALLCLTTVASASFLEVNQQLSLFTTWREVFGGSPVTTTGAPAQDSSGSRITPFTVTGQASGISLRVFAYLPPGYDTSTGRHTRYPVIEAFDGFPGSPSTWLKRLNVQAILDREIDAHRMAPTIVLFPYQTDSSAKDTECVDAVGGQKYDTFLTVDVPAAAQQQFRVRTDRAAWGMIGYSAGGFCAANLSLRHADRYAAAVVLSGYFETLTSAATGDLYHGNKQVQNFNTPLWRLKNLPSPALAMYIACAEDDRSAYSDMLRFATAAHAPLRVTTAVVPHGGHTKAVWEVLEAPAFDWLSNWLAAPDATSAPTAP
jgi:pimeloyl-ACP methyl ester carboxylesterase